MLQSFFRAHNLAIMTYHVNDELVFINSDSPLENVGVPYVCRCIHFETKRKKGIML